MQLVLYFCCGASQDELERWKQAAECLDTTYDGSFLAVVSIRGSWQICHFFRPMKANQMEPATQAATKKFRAEHASGIVPFYSNAAIKSDCLSPTSRQQRSCSDKKQLHWRRPNETWWFFADSVKSYRFFFFASVNCRNNWRQKKNSSRNWRGKRIPRTDHRFGCHEYKQAFANLFSTAFSLVFLVAWMKAAHSWLPSSHFMLPLGDICCSTRSSSTATTATTTTTTATILLLPLPLPPT